MARCTPLLAAGALLFSAACYVSAESSERIGTEIIIFVDFSESVRGAARDLIEHDFQRSIVPSLGPGDRILVAPINDKTLTDFHPLLDVTFPLKPVFNGWQDNQLGYSRELKKVEAEIARLQVEIEKRVPEILRETESSQQTDIFSSLVMAEKLFNDERHKVLILMSDMIVDYPPYRFDRMQWSKEKNAELMTELRAKGLMPDLSGVCIYVSGASAPTAELAGQISEFWQSYFERTQADMDSSRYAHVLLHWPPSSACAS